MATYQIINNSEIDADSPITASLMARLRDNPEAVREGDPTSPGSYVAGFRVGGGGEDDAVAMPTLAGFYAYNSLVDTVGGPLPIGLVIRVAGGVDLSGQTFDLTGFVSLAAGTRFDGLTPFIRAAAGSPGYNTGVGAGGDGLVQYGGLRSIMRANAGGVGGGSGAPIIPPGGGGGGGGAWGSGGAGDGTSGTLNNALGGSSGGGVLIIAEGDVDLSNTTWNGFGGDGSVSGTAGAGGGGAGSVRVICGGILDVTGAVFNFAGGNGGNTNTDGGGGGGGLVVGYGTAIAGAPTVDVAGGIGAGSAINGGNGFTEFVALALNQIRALVWSGPS